MIAPPWHAEPWAQMQGRLAAGRMPHALLLAGPAGLGKRAFAERLARRLLCTAPTLEGEACGRCRGCVLYGAGTHPDLLRVSFELNREGKPRSEIVIDQVRRLCDRLVLSSQFGGWKVALLDPADALNAAASNALLKTLEEPTRDALLLLLADVPSRLPATIRSRCQRLTFRVPARTDAQAWLASQDLADAPVTLDAAGGNPGLALRQAADGALQRRDAVRRDLAALAAGRANAQALAQSWQQDDPAQRLWFAAQALADELRARASGRRGPLGGSADAPTLGALFAQANRAREQLRGPLRGELVLLDLLSQRWS
ncbi:MAG TPA: DNA polymerase III subunit delta' [Rhodanobacteraceae bacterium]|nr:DNA polymerase III subunit delta' [Rhodanobacteraceae bacterium]